MKALAWVALPGLAAPLAFSQTASQAVSGTVTDIRDGRPLARATVTLTETRSREHVLTATTDGEGRFRFDAVPAGKYTLSAQAAHHLRSVYLEHAGFGTAIVTGAGLATEDLKLPLSPMSRIYGTIVDEAGEPVRNAQVELYRETPDAQEKVTRVRQTVTTDLGEYEFDQLRAGRFYVAATATPWYAVYPAADQPGFTPPYRAKPNPQLNVAYPLTFYPAAQDPQGAEALELKEGDELTANLQFQPVPALTLTVRQPANPNGGRTWPQLTRSVFGSEDRVQVQYGNAGDLVQMVGIAPGQYELEQQAMQGQKPLQTRAVDLRGQSLSLDAAPAEDTVNVTVNVHAAPGETLPKELTIGLQALRQGHGASVQLKGESKAVLADVAPGEYRLRAGGNGRSWYVAQLTVDGRPVSGAMLHVAARKDVAADVTITASAAEIDGFVQRDGTADAASMVVLAPEGEAPDPQLYRRDQSDLDGSFTFANVLPGRYRVAAIDDGWKLSWSDKAALAPYLKQAKEIDVPAGAKTTIKLPEPVEAVAAVGR